MFSRHTSEQIDAWANERDFLSLGQIKRKIQDDIDNNVYSSPGEVLSSNQRAMFYFDDDNWLRSYASDYLMSEFMNSNGIVMIENYLHHFHRDYHLIILDGTLAELNDLKETMVDDPENGVYVFENEAETWHTSVGEGESRESKYFNCPNSQSGGFYRFGHRKEVDVNGDKQRMVTDLQQGARLLPGSPTEILSYIGWQVENRKRSGLWSWIRTYPDYEFGTLSSQGSSGEVDAVNNLRDLRVDRSILVNTSFGNQPHQIYQSNVPMSEVGTSFREVRFGNADEFKNLEIVRMFVTGLDFGRGERATSLESWGGWRDGRISVNWLTRSTSMDIQLGCN